MDVKYFIISEKQLIEIQGMLAEGQFKFVWPVIQKLGGLEEYNYGDEIQKQED